VKGTFIEDFDNRICKGIFIINEKEIKGGWNIIA